jgi:hypothetical protein
MYLPENADKFAKSNRRKKSQPKIGSHQPASDLGKRYVKYFWHPWSAITAPAHSLQRKPAWKTIDYYLQPSQLWAYHQDKNKLIGVRFNSSTRYATIDLDAGGDYHNLEAYQTIKAALEDIGIVDTVPIQSSYSGGYHLIIPFKVKIPTFNLACALQQTLQDAGFKIRPGHIEIFPNPKPWGKDIITNYNAIRCPMQPGSGAFLLDDDLQAISDSVATFLDYCDRAARRQDLTKLRYACEKARKRHIRELYQQKASIKIEQWQAEWEQIIATGWTDRGQTNTLLQIIVGYGIVFKDLQHEDLVKYAVETARNAPGYTQYCHHQHHIETRVRDWVKCTIKHQWYTPYASRPKRPQGTFINTFALAIAGDSQTENHQNLDNIIPFEKTKIRNQQRSQQTQKRIEEIVKYLDVPIETLQDTETGLSQRVTQRGEQIRAEYKQRYNKTLSTNTLYKHKHLWHPQWYIPEPCEENSIKQSDNSLDGSRNQRNSKQPENSSNPYPDDNYTQFEQKNDQEKKEIARNPYPESNYTQLPYMKVLCNPPATSPAGAEVADVDQLQIEDIQKDSAVTQLSENQSIINSINRVENNLNQLNDELENSINATILQSNELSKLSLIQYFLCLFFRCASPKSDKQNLSIAGENELGISCAEATAEHSLNSLQRQQEVWSGELIELAISPETPATNGNNGGQIAPVGVNPGEAAEPAQEIADNDGQRTSVGEETPVAAVSAEPLLQGDLNGLQSDSVDNLIPNTEIPEPFRQNGKNGQESTSDDDNSRIEELKQLTKLKLMAVVHAQKKVREYCLISGHFVCGQERRHLEMKFRMQFYLDSGHEVLIAEATAWAEANTQD